MNSFQRGFTAALAAAVLLAIGGFVRLGPAAAQTTAGSTAVTCSPAAGNWTDCSIALNQMVPAGRSVVVSVNSPNTSVAFCWGGTISVYAQTDGDQTGAVWQVPGCSFQGNTVTFVCLATCPAGSALQVSTLGAPSPSLAGAIAVQVSGG